MENKCPVYKKCSGCQMQNLDYESQLAYKQKYCRTLLEKFSHVNAILGMDNPYHYRNKAQALFRYDGRKKCVVSGIYQSSTKAVVAVDSCAIEDEISDHIICTVRNLARKFRIMAYDERNGSGFLRHVMVRRGFTSGEVMVVLVTSVVSFSARIGFVKELTRLHPEITTIVQNINSSPVNLTFGEKDIVLYGDGSITDTLCGKKFRISPRSFYQVNPVQTGVLYSKAMEFAELSGKERVIDAYCGIGTIGIAVSDKAEQVVGVELNPDAVRDATENAKLNGAKNIRFVCADAGKFMSEMADAGETADVVFMDPTRNGSTMMFLKALAKLSPKKIVYISCNPETLARDLEILTKSYRAKKILPVDMFPMTRHCECLVLLERKEEITEEKRVKKF